jgi:hypothetical protein
MLTNFLFFARLLHTRQVGKIFDCRGRLKTSLGPQQGKNPVVYHHSGWQLPVATPFGIDKFLPPKKLRNC